MQQPDNNEEELNKLHIENEIKKMKLSLEHGASFFSSSNKNLPPEVESQWLNQIQQFEDSYKNCKRVLIYDFIGKPVYKSLNEIPPTEIKPELNKITELLEQKGININTICEVEEKELYRFIIEELFFEETDDMAIEGMSHNFIYEEFHPNHEYDIKSHSNDFINGLLNKEIDLNFIPMANVFFAKEGIIKKEELIKKLENFRESFSSFTLNDFEITSLNFDKENADVNFEINYSAIIEGSNEKRFFSGNGSIVLTYEYDYWSVCKINIPGIYF